MRNWQSIDGTRWRIERYVGMTDNDSVQAIVQSSLPRRQRTGAAPVNQESPVRDSTIIPGSGLGVESSAWGSRTCNRCRASGDSRNSGWNSGSTSRQQLAIDLRSLKKNTRVALLALISSSPDWPNSRNPGRWPARFPNDLRDKRGRLGNRGIGSWLFGISLTAWRAALSFIAYRRRLTNGQRYDGSRRYRLDERWPQAHRGICGNL